MVVQSFRHFHCCHPNFHALLDQNLSRSQNVTYQTSVGHNKHHIDARQRRTAPHVSWGTFGRLTSPPARWRVRPTGSHFLSDARLSNALTLNSCHRRRNYSKVLRDVGHCRCLSACLLTSAVVMWPVPTRVKSGLLCPLLLNDPNTVSAGTSWRQWSTLYFTTFH